MKATRTSLALFVLIVSQFIEMTLQCCSCSSMIGIGSGINVLGPFNAASGQISSVVSLSGFNLGSTAEVFSSFAIAGFKAPSNQQYYSLVVDTVLFTNGNTLMTFVVKYQYNNIKTSWTKVKLSWLAVSTAFTTVDPVNKMGQYVWAGSAGLDPPFPGISTPMIRSSIFQTQSAEMESSAECGYLNISPPIFDLTCAGFPNSRFVTHLYIMGFQFNPIGGPFTLAASALRNNGGLSLSDLD